MSFIPPGCAECTVNWRVPTGTEPIVSVFGLLDNVGGSAPDAALAAVGLAFVDLLAVLPAELTLDSLRVVDADGSEEEAQLGVVGSGGGTCAPPQVTYLVNKRTGVIGRANKGRWFLPGVDEGEIGPGGFLSSGHRTSINDGLDSFLDTLIAEDWPMVVLHAVEGPTVREVTSLQVQEKVATLKQRVR